MHPLLIYDNRCHKVITALENKIYMDRHFVVHIHFVVHLPVSEKRFFIYIYIGPREGAKHENSPK